MKLKLDQTALEDDFFESSRLMGIIASVKAYQLCWQLNHSLGFDFSVNTEIEIIWKKKSRTFYFPIYEYLEKGKAVSHYLYTNHNKAEFLLPELKHIDFLWLIQGDFYTDEEINQLMNQLRNVSAVQLVNLFELKGLKNKQNLIF